jgi:hypothetical protein
MLVFLLELGQLDRCEHFENGLDPLWMRVELSLCGSAVSVSCPWDGFNVVLV